MLESTRILLDRTVPVFGPSFRDELQLLLQWRRDVRRFLADPVDDVLFERIIQTAWLAPSVGLSQPWRFVVVEDPVRRAAVRATFARCNQAALDAQSDARSSLYARLKLAGLDQAPRHIAVFVEPDPGQGHGLGRQTMAQTVAYSAVLAIHTLWLTARAAGLGLGWVSILDPAEMNAALDVDPGWQFVAYLCLGYPEAESDLPALECAGWEQRRGPTVESLLRR
jgi:5,6-dimethylbenzimidazole synthase